MASTLRMRTAISPEKRQPWTAVLAMLGLISMARWSGSNRPLPCSLVPLFQNESKCENLSYENEFCMQFHFHANQSHFHKNDFALRLALKQSHKATRKWPIRTNSLMYAAIYCQCEYKAPLTSSTQHMWELVAGNYTAGAGKVDQKICRSLSQ